MGSLMAMQPLTWSNNHLVEPNPKKGRPCRRPSEAPGTACASEGDFAGQLDVAVAKTLREGAAAGCAPRRGAEAEEVIQKPAGGAILDVRVGGAVVGAVHDVEGAGLQNNVEPLGKPDVLARRHVDVVEAVAAQGIAVDAREGVAERDGLVLVIQ